MKLFKSIILIFIFIIPLSMMSKTHKTLFVILDGIPADCIERLQPPTIMDVAHTGHYHRALCGGEQSMYSQTPTISAIGYTNILTGTWMNKHNVQGNENIHINYNYWNIFRIAKAQDHPVKTAIYTGWTDNRTILLGTGKSEAGNLQVDYAYDGYDLDTLHFPHKPDELHVFDIDRQVSADAAKSIRSEAPDLSWLYLWYTDDAFHSHGGGTYSDRFIMKADSMLANVWKAIKYREKKFNEEWLLIITTDHGRYADGFGHGGQTARERTIWISTNLKDVNEHFYESSLSHVDINPTICKWMGFSVPRDVAFEQDGMSFYGKQDITNLFATKYDDQVVLTWNPHKTSAMATIYATSTNLYAKGDRDIWQKMGTVKASSGSFSVDMKQLPKSKLYKYEVVTPSSHLTRWWNIY
jgi:hypothetical protein